MRRSLRKSCESQKKTILRLDRDGQPCYVICLDLDGKRFFDDFSSRDDITLLTDERITLVKLIDGGARL